MRAIPTVESLESRDCPQPSILWLNNVLLVAPKDGAAIVVATMRPDPSGQTGGALQVAVWQKGRASVVDVPADAVGEIVVALAPGQMWLNTSGIADLVVRTTLGPRGRD